MKKIFTIIALLILILVSLVAIGVSFGNLSKNEKENEILLIQIKQNAELKEKLSKIEYDIRDYGKRTEMFNQIKIHIDIEEADLKKENEALEEIKKELDGENEKIEKEEKRLEKEHKRLIGVDASLDKAEKQLSADERALMEESHKDSNQKKSNESKKDKQKELKALQTRRTNLNIAKTKQENAWKTYQKDVKDLENSKQEHEIEENSYNIRQKGYGEDCLAFNQKNGAFKVKQSKHKERSVEIQKLREKKAKIEQKISAFEKANPDIQAKYDEFQKTKSYLTMVVATFSFLLLVLIILLVFVLVFERKNKSQKPKIKDINVSSSIGYMYKAEKTMENNEVKENFQGFLSMLFNGKKSHTKESEYGASKQTQNISVDDIIGLKNYVSNFEKRLRQLENDHISTETGTSQENDKLDAVLSKIAGIYSKLDGFDKRLRQLENDHISTETGTSQENNKFDVVLSKIAWLSSGLYDLNARINEIEEKASDASIKHNEKTITQPIKNGAFEERLKQLEEKMREIESIFDYEDDEKND